MAGKVKLPSSGGGIIQYYDEYKSKIEITPVHVIIITIAVMLGVVLMHIIG
ncbi:MAG TPA: preprotein translocase subunit Sec61beta [Candidatus Woesearchaeota archaeon]|nr:preprotein translocase subunit Sec61beta [Candidatus Woesearchaeota archaeon]